MRGHTTEMRHRRLVQAAIVVLLVLSVVPATGRIALATAPFLERCRELLAQCTLVLRSTGAPLHWLPVALLVAGAVYAVVDRVRLTARVSRVLATLRTRRAYATEPVGCLSREFEVEGDVRVLIGIAPNPAFTAGILRPRIYLSESLQRTLSPAELRAVFRHEFYHRIRRDPLRFAVLRFAAKTFFWFPLLRVLAEDLMEDAEIMADDFAASPRGGSDPLDVASALVKIGRANSATLAGTAAIGGSRLLDRRVRRLADEPVKPATIPWASILRSVSLLLFLWGSSTFASGTADAGMTMRLGDRCPHAMEGMVRHCPKCGEHGETMRGCRHGRDHRVTDRAGHQDPDGGRWG